MALKAIMLRRSIEKKTHELAALRERDGEFERREAELETAINEAETEEDEAAVSEEIEKFETEKEAHEGEKKRLQEEIEGLEAELKETESKAPGEPESRTGREGSRRTMERRNFFGMNMQEREAFLADNNVKAFLSRVREIGSAAPVNKRAVTGADLTIPTAVLELIRQNIMDYSKLVRRVRLRTVSGKARQTVMGTIPEAVWTEMCAKLNEIDFGFTQTEVDGYKVGGVIYICKATLEDSDLELAAEIIDALGIAIGIALDKAILYGLGTKMPLGIVTRLAQESAPSDYPATARPWQDLHTSNMITIQSSSTGLEFFKEIVLAGGKASNKYARGTKFWAMNETTYTKIKVEAMNFNSAGAIVSVQDGAMPVAGGDIVVLSDDIIPDNNIVAGYGELYLLAERAGSEFARSDEYRFAEDQVAFKGTARYDGDPVIAEGFIAIGLGAAPQTSMAFAGDTANDATLEALDLGSALTPAFAPNKYEYTFSATSATVTAEAIATQDAAQIVMTYDGKKVRNGGTLTLADTKDLVVTVTNGLGKQTYTVSITKTGA
ncbi:phage major capsid protein [Lachnoclostridium sp. An14]|uniref:phage major capsid protein n=1 Tax=Lachnoclostridium sp. An14 TaxID=1965562 RepID=UPI000B3AACC6|nr:phage major capsid protein [Lachnoclostridium sp. An14]OUQ12395.1 phage major capsid protein [Lachnoclostridium sp. An14]